MGCPFIHGAIALLASFIIRYSITADIQGKMETEVKIKNKQGISTIYYFSPLRQTTIYLSIHPFMVKAWSLHSTFLWAAARLWTTRTAHIAAALLRAALAAAYTEEQDEQQSTDDDQQDRQPVCGRGGEIMSVAFHFVLLPWQDFVHPMTERTVNDEFDFTIGVSDCVTRRVNVAEVHPVVPPHDLSDDEISTCWTTRSHKDHSKRRLLQK